MHKTNFQIQTEPQFSACPACGATAVRSEIRQEHFTYGNGSSSAEIEVAVPVRICSHCHFEYTDGDADVIRSEAVCRHLGRLSPREIKGLRKLYKMSRAEFASIGEFGEASLARWERGELVQNSANDQLLYLLMFRENIERLRERAQRVKSKPKERGEEHPRVEALGAATRFPALLDMPTAQREARDFALAGPWE